MTNDDNASFRSGMLEKFFGKIDDYRVNIRDKLDELKNR